MTTIGIDFGTTKTMVSRWNPKTGRPEVIYGGGALPLIPTAIYIDQSGHMEFGQDALDQLEDDPGGYFSDLKRHLGDTESHVIHGRSYTIVDLSAEFLRWLKRQIEEQVLYEVIDQAIITVPALYGRSQRADLLAAARKAGFTAELVDEPLAAGLAFLDEVQNTRLDENMLVVDWGGGTLDLAVLDRTDGSIILHSDLTGGREDLGGRDIDDAILNHVNRWPETDGHSSLTQQPPERYSRVLRELERCKIAFSNKETVNIRLALETGPWQRPWQRDEFEGVILQAIEDATREVAALAKRATNRKVFPSQVLLVGGSSKLRLLEIAVKNQLAIEPVRWHRSIEAVALGAAVYANRLAEPTARKKQAGKNNGADIRPDSKPEPKPKKGKDVRVPTLIDLSKNPPGSLAYSSVTIDGEIKSLQWTIPRNPAVSPFSQEMRFKGMGELGTGGGNAGDIILEISSIIGTTSPPPPQMISKGPDQQVSHTVITPPGSRSETSFLQEGFVRTIQFEIPRDFTDGQVVTIPGKGFQGGEGGLPGDLLIELKKQGERIAPARALEQSDMPPVIKWIGIAVIGAVVIGVIIFLLGTVLPSIFSGWLGLGVPFWVIWLIIAAIRDTGKEKK